MGFFSDLKEDLSQAVNELMPEEEQIKAGAVQAEMKEEASADTEKEVSLDEMLKNIDEVQLPEDMTVMEEPAEKAIYGQDTAVVPEETVPVGEVAAQVVEAEAELAAAEAQDMEKMLSRMLEESPAAEPQQKNQMEENKGAERTMEITNRVATDETSIITTGMVVTGDLTTEGSIDVAGTVNGNIDALGKLNITGHVNGNSKAAEIYAENAKINGEIVSEGAVKIEASTVIIGNITANSAAIAGAVKGDIDVKGPVILDASAIVMGNIKSKSVQINNGAVIEGMCSQCYADVSPTSFFDDYKPEVHTKAKSR